MISTTTTVRPKRNDGEQEVRSNKLLQIDETFNILEGEWFSILIERKRNIPFHVSLEADDELCVAPSSLSELSSKRLYEKRKAKIISVRRQSSTIMNWCQEEIFKTKIFRGNLLFFEKVSIAKPAFSRRSNIEAVCQMINPMIDDVMLVTKDSSGVWLRVFLGGDSYIEIFNEIKSCYYEHSARKDDDNKERTKKRVRLDIFLWVGYSWEGMYNQLVGLGHSDVSVTVFQTNEVTHKA